MCRFLLLIHEYDLEVSNEVKTSAQEIPPPRNYQVS